MPVVPTRLPSLMGGVSTVSPALRTAIELEAVDNCDVDLSRGLDKRAGTEHIDGDGSTGSLNIAGATNDMHFFWINRDTGERFVGMIDPNAASDLNLIQIWDIDTGNEVTVQAVDSSGSEVNLDNADTLVAAMVTYLKAGSQTPQQRFRTLTVEDGTFILNRTVTTALEGTAITYRDSGGSNNVRQQSYAQNVTAWSDFTHPPGTTATYPTRAALLAGGNIDSDAIWYASDDDVGLPQGFYWAVSGTQPPWFTRLPTESANSYIQRDTMPLLLAYTGSQFNLQVVDWEPRKAGDGTTNPGPSFIGNPIDDITFHQGRLWFASGERIVSSRAGDIYNLWIDSVSLVTDADPIDDAVQGNRVSNIRLLESFRESLILMTDGARQLELRANGPITPQSYQLFNSTDIFSANYAEPERRASQMYFFGERDAAMLVWEYDYSPTQVSNVAADLTRRVHGYIPAEAHWMTSSNAHNQLFVLSLADPDAIYVNTGYYEQGERVLNSWFRWVYPDADKIRSCAVYDDYLYMLVERGSLVFLERQALGEPLQDTSGGQTLDYAVRLDRKQALQGVYDSGANTTTFTLEVRDDDASWRIVTGPEFDTASVKGAGVDIDLSDITVSNAGGFTTLTVEGDLANNADGSNAVCFIGVDYDADAELSEIMVRDEQGNPVHGNVHLMRMRVRHRDSGGYSVVVIPDGRDQFQHDFTVPSVGATPIDSDQLDDFGEFQTRIMAHARNTRIILRNSTPFPTAWIDADFDVTFSRTYSPVR